MTLDVTDYIEDIDVLENEYSKAVKKVKKELKEAGIIPPKLRVDKHGYLVRPTIPPGLGDMHFSELTKILSDFAEYSSYVKYQLADIRIAESRAARTLRDIKAHLRIRLGGNATDKADRMARDKRFIEADLKEFEAKSKRRLAEAVDEGVEKSFFAVSRAITSRGHEKEQVDRDANTGGRVPQPKLSDPLEKFRRKQRARRS